MAHRPQPPPTLKPGPQNLTQPPQHRATPIQPGEGFCSPLAQNGKSALLLPPAGPPGPTPTGVVNFSRSLSPHLGKETEILTSATKGTRDSRWVPSTPSSPDWGPGQQEVGGQGVWTRAKGRKGVWQEGGAEG